MKTRRDDVESKKLIFESAVRSRTNNKNKPIGYEILKHVIQEHPTLEILAFEINQIKSAIVRRCAISDIALNFTDQRRALSYAMMLFGIRQWQSFIKKYYPKAVSSEHCQEMWWNKYSNLELFIEDIVRPLEEGSRDVLLQQNQAAAFTAWLQSYVAREGDEEEGHTWMRAKRGDYIYITDGILQRYKEFSKRSGSAAYETLTQLAVDLTSHTGEDCKPYPNDIGLDEVRDSDERIVKMPVPYKKRKVVKVPLSVQGKLVTTTTITTTITDNNSNGGCQ
jgi:hypothetical protein